AGLHFLRQALSVLLPTDADTHLLRAILYSGDAGRQAWRHWQHRAGDPLVAFERLPCEQKGLLPMLHRSVARNGVEVEADVASFLRAADFREELRGNAYRRVLRQTARALAVGATPPVILRGCAIADTVYDAPQARHSHGIHLLVHEVDLSRAGDRLAPLGYTPAQKGRGFGAETATRLWTHVCGLPLALHTRLIDVPYYDLPMGFVWARTRPLHGFEAVAATLAPEDALLHICGNAAESATRHSLRWVCDAWLLITRERALDWTLFLDTAKAARLALPLSLMMRYLAEALEAPVPAEVCARLDALAGNVDDVGHEVAVVAALGGAHARMRRVLATAPDWPARGRLLRCLLMPSPACARALGHGPGIPRLSGYYLARVLRYAARTSAGLLRELALVLACKVGRSRNQAPNASP
ncbi:MAG: nucleotidyltransferase family protein, partial [Salinisphaera sp.]|nr:nucleotidyltransferase family protein [Salinisphaera sp.]